MSTNEARDRRWFAAVERIEAEIERVTASLYAKLEVLEDQRCGSCGAFVDDAHSKDCRFGGRS